MTTSPQAFDLVLSDAAAVDVARLGQSKSADVDVLFASLMADPTEANPAVRNLTNGGPESLYRYLALDYTVLYKFLAPFLIEIVAVAPFPLDPD